MNHLRSCANGPFSHLNKLFACAFVQADQQIFKPARKMVSRGLPQLQQHAMLKKHPMEGSRTHVCECALTAVVKPALGHPNYQSGNFRLWVLRPEDTLH